MKSRIDWIIWILITIVIIVAVELIILLFTKSLTVTFESLGGVAAAAALISTIYYYSKQVEEMSKQVEEMSKQIEEMKNQNKLLKREVEEVSKRADIHFDDDLLFNYFSHSVRVFLKVKNKENVSVTNAMCFIYIQDMWKLKDYMESNIYVNGDDKKMWEPLVNANDRFREVEGEPLSWNVWLNNNFGIESMQFRYLTIIPALGTGLAELMDIYLCEGNDGAEKFYILRVFSEYGPEQKPKVIFKLPIGGDVEIKIRVKATGDRVKNTAKGEVIIKPTDEGNDYQINFNSHTYRIGEFFTSENNKQRAERVKC
nr:hypothetical protein [Sulfolobus islandicus]